MSVPIERPLRAAQQPVVADEPRVTIEMGGPNIVIRSSTAIDREYTATLAHAVNAATATHTVVVLDPDPIRCDDSFAGADLPASETACAEHAECRPSEVEVVGSGIIRIAAQSSWWLIDVAHGRFCRTDGRVDPHFIDGPSWTSVIAVCVTPSRIRALTLDGSVISCGRAHDHTDLGGPGARSGAQPASLAG